VYIIDRINPVMICRVNVIPNKNPIFHINEIEEGEGKSKRDFFTILRIGLLLISCFFIRRKKKSFGWGDAHAQKWLLL
jgi:hypothetical protein